MYIYIVLWQNYVIHIYFTKMFLNNSLFIGLAPISEKKQLKLGKI